MVAASSPERRCALTRERSDPHGLIRFVRSPDGVATPDLAERLPGRGLWLTASREVVEEARRKGVFSRGFKAQTSAPEDLASQIAEGLGDRIEGAVRLARRAGEFVNGSDAVRAALKSGAVGLLVEASDGAADGRSKVFAAARAGGFDGKVIGLFDARRIGLAVGRDNVVHGALLCGGLAAKATREAERLSGFRPLTPPDWPMSAEGAVDGPGSPASISA